MKYFTLDFVIHADFTYIAASNAIIDDITNWIKHRIYYIDLITILFLFCVKFGKNLA